MESLKASMCSRLIFSNSSLLFFSRLNSWSTAIPLTCSCRYALILAMAMRMRR